MYLRVQVFQTFKRVDLFEFEYLFQIYMFMN